MNTELTQQILVLQQQIYARLSMLGYSNGHSAEIISRHLAEIAVLGKAFVDTTLPLFLTLNTEHSDSLAQLVVSVKCDLEEITDAMVDVDVELRKLMEYLNSA